MLRRPDDDLENLERSRRRRRRLVYWLETRSGREDEAVGTRDMEEVEVVGTTAELLETGKGGRECGEGRGGE